MNNIVNAKSNETISNRFFYYFLATFVAWAAVLSVATEFMTESSANIVVGSALVISTIINANIAHCDNDSAVAAGYKPTSVIWVILFTPIVWGLIRLFKTRQGGWPNFKGFVIFISGILLSLVVIGSVGPNEDDAMATRVCEIINEPGDDFFLNGVKCDHAEFDGKPGKNTWTINVYKTDGTVSMVTARYDVKNDYITVF